MTRRTLDLSCWLLIATLAASQPADAQQAASAGETVKHAAAKPAATWSDVAPIFAEHCTGCHTEGTVAPMSLRSFRSARPWARSIERAVRSRAMPPWFADPEIGRFSNDARLDDQKIATIEAWVQAGAPAGDEQNKTIPADPKLNQWRLGEPDLVVEMPRPFEIPASGTVDYQYVRLPLGNAEPLWVRAVEVIVGSPENVHHADVIACSKGCERSRGLASLQPGVMTELPSSPITEKPVFSSDAVIVGEGEQYIYSFLPGGSPLLLPEDTGRLIPASGEIVLNMHYTTSGEPASDQSKVGLHLHSETPKRRAISYFLDNETFWIPPGESKHEVRSLATLAVAAELLAVTPHMHVRGAASSLLHRSRDGKPDTVLSLPNYDFNWQITYQLAQPLPLQRGEVLELINVFDNSVQNLDNPDPSRPIPWGRQSWDEMSSAFIDLAVPATVDPSEVFARN